jgi:hypothetical protein
MLGGLPSTSSSTSVVAIARPTGSTPRGLPLTSSSTSVVAATGPVDNTPHGAHHRRLPRIWWWPLLDPPVAPPGGPPLMTSSTSVVVAVRLTGSTPRGAAIDVFLNIGSATAGPAGCTPQGARHRRLTKGGSYC